MNLESIMYNVIAKKLASRIYFLLEASVMARSKGARTVE